MATVPTPAISVVIPTFNRARLLRQALATLLAQTFTDFEAIVVDDGSTDSTPDVLASLSDPRIVHIRQPNLGEYAATNRGLRAARGPLITWMHSDDRLPATSLADRAAAFGRAPRLELVHGTFTRIDGRGRVLDVWKPAALGPRAAVRRYVRDYLTGDPETPDRYLVHHLTMMFRRRLLDRVGAFDERLPYAGDFDWILRALWSARGVRAVPNSLYSYRFHAQARRFTDDRAGNSEEAVVAFILERQRRRMITP